MRPSSSQYVCALVTIDYDLDIVSVTTLRQQIDSITHNISKLIIDLTHCAFVDTIGIAELVAAHRRSLAEGFRLALVIPSALMRLFTMIGLDKLFAIFPTLTGAEADDALTNPAVTGDPQSFVVEP